MVSIIFEQKIIADFAEHLVAVSHATGHFWVLVVGLRGGKRFRESESERSEINPKLMSFLVEQVDERGPLMSTVR